MNQSEMYFDGLVVTYLAIISTSSKQLRRTSLVLF